MKINHMYVDVRAKKLKTIGNSLKTCAPVEKKSAFGWEKYNWALTRELQF